MPLRYLKPHDIRDVGNLKLRRILDSDDSFSRRNIIGKCIQKSRLADTCAAADEYVIARTHKYLQVFCSFLGDGAHLDQLLHRNTAFRKLSNRKNRSRKAYRRQHNIHSGAVVQPCINDWIGFVDDTVHTRSNLLDHILQSALVAKMPVASIKPSLSLIKDLLGAVDHNLGDRAILDKILQYIEPP